MRPHNVRRQIRNVWRPGQDQESNVVGDEPDVLTPRLGRLADEAIARPEMLYGIPFPLSRLGRCAA